MTRFARSVAEVNDHILAGLGDERDALCLALALTIGMMTTESLLSLLLNQEGRRDYKKSKNAPAPFKEIFYIMVTPHYHIFSFFI